MARRTYERYVASTYAEVHNEVKINIKDRGNKIVNYSHSAGGPWTAIISVINTDNTESEF